MKLTGAQIIWETLIQQGSPTVFGYPGGAIMPAYDALLDYPQIKHVLMRHEENAALAADAYFRVTGKVGVCMATSGPGATNLVTGLANAMMDSSAVVAITGQVASHLVGSDAFQETDVTGITLPVTKHNWLVTDLSELAQVLAEAFHIARSGRPGPVLVDICKDVQQKSIEYTPVTSVNLRGYKAAKPQTKPQDMQAKLSAAQALIAGAKKPIILAGQGIKHANAHEEFKAFVEKSGIPVTTTLLGIGVLSEDHPQNLRMMGMHGEAYVNQAIAGADLLLAFGMRFDDRVTGNLKTYAKNARVIHVDIDAAEIGKNVPAEVGIVASLKDVLPPLTSMIEKQTYTSWMAQISEWRGDTQAHDITKMELPPEMLLAPQVIKSISDLTGGNCTVCTDVGQHQMWETQYFQHRRKNQLITSGGLGTMGFALPAAIGVKFANPTEEVWAIAGDGGFQMSLPEMATVMQEGLDIKIAIVNNNFLGMVRQWQELMHDKRYSSVNMWTPNFVKVAEGYGIPAIRATTLREAREAIEKARAHKGPFLIEFSVEQETNVFPMIQPGKSLNEMTRRPVQPAALGGGMDTVND
jgi:acetolactate synthase I/II/III large subunit